MKIWVLTILCVASFGWAGSYAYHPSNALYLGAGFDPAYPDRAFRPCIAYSGKSNVDGQGAIRTEYSLSLVGSKKELFDRLSISASLSARGLFWGAGANVDYFSEHKFHSDSLTWMLMGKSEYGRLVMNDAQLLPFAKQMLDAGNSEAFQNSCGSEFVKQERRAVLISAIFSIENVASEDKSRLESQFNASYSSGFFDVEVKNKYAKFFSEASRVNRIKLSIYAVGGGGITQLSSLVLKPDDLEEVQRVIKSYMDTLDESRAVPCEYLSGSMSAFGYRGHPQGDAFRRERVLADLYYRSSDAYNTYKRLESILSSWGSHDYASLSDGDMKRYQALFNQYAAYLNTLQDAADACYGSIAECKLPPSNLDRVVWPVNQVSECEKLRLKAYYVGLIDDKQLDKFRELGLAPVFQNPSSGIQAQVICEAMGLGR